MAQYMISYNQTQPKQHYLTLQAFSKKYSKIFNKQTEIMVAWRELMVDVAVGLINQIDSTMPFYGALSTVGIENEDIFAKFLTTENDRKSSDKAVSSEN